MKHHLGWVVIMIGLTACSSAPPPAHNTASATPPVAPSTPISPGNRLTCSLDNDVRALEIKKTKTDGCELFYTRSENAKAIATGAKGEHHCREVREKIFENLTRSGFKCE